MGYSTSMYVVDIDRLRAAFGSKDRTLLEAVERENADEFHSNGEQFAAEIRRGAPTLREALAQLVEGTIPANVADGFQHGYALELLCRRLGQSLDGDDFVEFIDDLEIPTGLIDSGPPLPIPECADFPSIGFLTAEQVRGEAARLEGADLSHEDEDIEAAREEFRSCLRQAAEKGWGLVSVSY